MDINELNDFELGVAKGFIAAQNGDSELQVIQSETNVKAKEGIREGFRRFRLQNPLVKDSLKSALVACKSGTLESKFALREILLDIRDSEDPDYEIIEENGESRIVEVFPKEDVDKIKSRLDEDDNLEIVLNAEDKIYVGEKVTDSIEVADDDSEYTLEKLNNSKYQVLKNGEPAYELTKKQTNWQCSCPGFRHRKKCKHIGLLEDVLPKRHPRSELEKYLPELKALLEPLFGPIYNESTREGRWAIVGSFRRGVKDFKDIDIIIEATKSEFEDKVLPTLQQDPNYENIMNGPDIVRGYYHGWYFDVTRVVPGEWGSYLLYRTGSADFNMSMRALAKKLGYSLNEHGLFNRETGELIANKSEEDIFRALGLEYIEPKDRK